MLSAAERLEFEKADLLRDQISLLKKAGKDGGNARKSREGNAEKPATARRSRRRGNA